MTAPAGSASDPAPLAGRRILLLRPPDASPDLAAEITGLGGVPIEVPLAEFVAMPGILDDVRRELGLRPDYLVFTSARGVRAVAPVVAELTSATEVAAVGPATADALAAAGKEPVFVPERSTAASLAASLPFRGNNRVLAPLAELAGPDLAEGLSDRGFSVTTLVAYRLRPLEPDRELWRSASNADAVVFTAPSMVDRCLAVGRAAAPVTISIGPRTTGRLTEVGWEDVIEATSHDRAGIIDALVAALSCDS